VRGICSNYLADVKPGDELVMTGPAGTALLLADNPWNKRIVCVSTGALTAALCFAPLMLSLCGGSNLPLSMLLCMYGT
jgi:Na+-transporting NADH:ubiquinone oxidoreductase subunit NqrF